MDLFCVINLQLLKTGSQVAQAAYISLSITRISYEPRSQAFFIVVVMIWTQGFSNARYVPYHSSPQEFSLKMLKRLFLIKDRNPRFSDTLPAWLMTRSAC